MKQLVLASASPRRKELVKKLEVPFLIDPSNFEEYVDMAKKPQELAIALSQGKAKDVAKRHNKSIILGADTFVVLEGRYLNKPTDRKDAEEMLVFQSGKKEEVVTGYTLFDTDTGKTVSNAVTSYVYLKPYTNEEISVYLDRNTYMDKAGAYAIQEVGDIFIEKIEGDQDNIVGLPITDIRKALQDFF